MTANFKTYEEYLDAIVESRKPCQSFEDDGEGWCKGCRFDEPAHTEDR